MQNVHSVWLCVCSPSVQTVGAVLVIQQCYIPNTVNPSAAHRGLLLSLGFGLRLPLRSVFAKVESASLQNLSFLCRRIRGAYRKMPREGTCSCVLGRLVSERRPCFNHGFASRESARVCVDVSGVVFCLSSRSTKTHQASAGSIK